MKTSRISRNYFQPYSKLVNDFTQSSGALKSRFKTDISPETVGETIALRNQFNFDRILLNDVLQKQYNADDIDIHKSKEVWNNIEKLKESSTFTVTTGHQLCLFTGPFFFIIKILQAIKLANQFTKWLPDYKFVPVFWMATEDHDFEEINHVHLFNKKLEWSDEQGGAVGRYKVDSMTGILEEIKGILGNSEKAMELEGLFSNAYKAGRTLSASTRKLVHELFNKWGLVIIDGDDHKLKSQFIPELRRELSEGIIHESVQHDAQFLSESGYDLQINPRKLNLFYLGKNVRNRLDFEGEEVVEADGTRKWSKQDILKELEGQPENFSPNVLSRPVYQEKILPNICYVGGPAEISYWLELYSSFREFGIPFPLLNLRNSLMWIDKAKFSRLNKLGLEINDLFEEESTVTSKLVGFEEDEDKLDAEIRKVHSAFLEMGDLVGKTDPTLEPFILAEGRKLEKQMTGIKDKVKRAKKKRKEDTLNAYWNLREKLFPSNALHERYDNFVPYFLAHGRDCFEIIYDAIDPGDSRLGVISEKD